MDGAARHGIGAVAIAIGVVAFVMTLFEHSVKLIGKTPSAFFDTGFSQFVEICNIKDNQILFF